MSDLAQHECLACTGDVPPLDSDAIDGLLVQLNDDWEVVDDHHLTREYTFKGYPPAVDFTNRVAAIAEAQNHHPDILLTWGKVTVTIWTHKIDGLTESDFYFAAKTEAAYTEEG
jgi:4a-hydroxytetrahydrobiopterin dehydratase